jgi:hypothetical protein
MFLFSKVSRPSLGSTRPPNQWVLWALKPAVQRPGQEAGHSPIPHPGLRVNEAVTPLIHMPLRYAWDLFLQQWERAGHEIQTSLKFKTSVTSKMHVCLSNKTHREHAMQCGTHRQQTSALDYSLVPPRSWLYPFVGSMSSGMLISP